MTLIYCQRCENGLINLDNAPDEEIPERDLLVYYCDDCGEKHLIERERRIFLKNRVATKEKLEQDDRKYQAEFLTVLEDLERSVRNLNGRLERLQDYVEGEIKDD